MPNKKSAAKNVRKTVKRNLRNRMVKTELKTAFKKLTASIAANPAEAKAMYNEYQSQCDKAAKRDIIHSNTAARYKSRAVRLLGAKKD